MLVWELSLAKAAMSPALLDLKAQLHPILVAWMEPSLEQYPVVLEKHVQFLPTSAVAPSATIAMASSMEHGAQFPVLRDTMAHQKSNLD